MKSVLIVGAGMLGKGFLGEVFDASPNWQVAYLDNDPRVIEEMQDGFTVECCRVSSTDIRVITDYEAYLADQTYSCMGYALNADTIMLCIYPEDLDEAIGYLAPIFHRRAKENPNAPLDIILNTNLNHYIDGVVTQFQKALEEHRETLVWFSKTVYVRDSIIRRSTVADSSHDAKNIRTHCVASLLIQSPLHHDLSDVEWMELRDNVVLLKDMKLFAVNAPHAALAYMGYHKGCHTLDEAVKDPEIAAILNEVVSEATHGLTREFGLSEAEVLDMASVLTIQTKKSIGDSLIRIGFDPIRKLARNDRLTGNAMFCYKHGRFPHALVTAIAYAFRYDNPEDASAQQIQQAIGHDGIVKAIETYCGLSESHPLTQSIAEAYHKII